MKVSRSRKKVDSRDMKTKTKRERERERERDREKNQSPFGQRISMAQKVMKNTS